MNHYWTKLQEQVLSRAKPIVSAIGDAVDYARQQIAEWGPYLQMEEPSLQRREATSQKTTRSFPLGIGAKMASVTTIDLLALATSLPYAGQISSFSSGIVNLTIQQYADSFSTILGPSPSWQLIAEEEYQAFHEAGVYHQNTNSLFITSNWAGDFTNPINVSILNLDDYSVTSRRYDGLSEMNGGTTYVTPGTHEKPQILLCDQGDLVAASGLTTVDPVTNTTSNIMNNFYGRNFSSVNDVRQHYKTGDLWFTDAQYGYLQSFRPPPSIPNQIYRFEPLTGNIQVVADGFVQSNGLEFSPDFKTLYVSDTGAQLVEQGLNLTRPATVYAYDVVDMKFLRNRRVFAYIDTGVPDGIHTDTKGNVFVGCGDGVQVFNLEGRLVGKLRVDGGSANFAFVPEGMIVFNEYRLFLVVMAARGRELARDFGLAV